MGYAIRVKPGSRVDLSKIDTRENGGLTKVEGKARLEELSVEIDDLQDLMYAASQHSFLVVLQGMDTSGKDGTIRHVLQYVDPLGCRVWPFKVPTELEQAHDFLWRAHDKVPEIGMMTVFNRSYYEDVLVARVKDLVPVDVWRGRYDEINDFERLLTSNGTILVKFFLHISPEEQSERLYAREQDVEKSWKLSVGDWKERRYWDDYQEAYEDALGKCSTKQAPWYIVPSDRKWFRNLAVAERIVKTLRPYRQQWVESLWEEGVTERAALEEYRSTKEGREAMNVED